MKRRYLLLIGAVCGGVYALVWTLATTGPETSLSGIVPVLLIVGGAFGAFAGGIGALADGTLETTAAEHPLKTALLAGLAAAIATLVPTLALFRATPEAALFLGMPAAVIAFGTVAAYSWRRSRRHRPRTPTATITA